MDRNTEERFSQAARVTEERSKFLMKQNIKTTFNASYLIPFYVDSDILPGDTYKVKMSCVIRMTTPIKPVMDNCYLDIYFFYIPNRILWTHWKEFCGENTAGAWAQTTEYTIPQLKTSASTSFAKGDVMDYMGLPIGINNLSISALPLRAYIKTYNDWFRDQTQIAPLTENTGDSDTNYTVGSVTTGAGLVKVGKYHDYFTSCLPDSQKGTAVKTPLGTSAPVSVFGTGKSLGITDGTNNAGLKFNSNTTLQALQYSYDKNVGTADSTGTGGLTSNVSVGVVKNPETSGLTGIVDLTNATAATINALRLAFATQRILEKDARGGTRYTEVIRQHFGVVSPDARQQRPEYLGGKRIPINMDQISQTSSTDATTPQGNMAAYSLTADVDDMFTKSFTEHGIILGLCCVRQEHSYQQGIARQWSRKRRLDYYWPSLAHISEQPVKNKEIYAQGSAVVDSDGNVIDEQTFGFQEAWAEYRYKANIITGELRSTYTTPLDSWHYGDKYNSLPVLAQTFIEETDIYINRTLAVQNQDQFIMDCLVDIEATRPMPVYSIPGLLDHF